MVPLLKGLNMPRGRKTSLSIRLTPAQRQTLLAWQRSTAIPAGLARRTRILLLLADGVTITDIAATVGMSRQHVYKWIHRFVQQGVEGLQERPGRRHRRESRPPGPTEHHDWNAG
jgi:CRP-like cAMP-binding protein